MRHSKLTQCELCFGRGWVPQVACKGCGRPAFKFWPPKQYPLIQYCGLEDCFNKLVKLHLPKKPEKKREEPVRYDLQDLKRAICERNSKEEREKRREREGAALACANAYFGPCGRA